MADGNGYHLRAEATDVPLDGGPIEWERAIEDDGFGLVAGESSLKIPSTGYLALDVHAEFAEETQWKGDTTVTVEADGSPCLPTPQTGWGHDGGLGASFRLATLNEGQQLVVRIDAEGAPTASSVQLTLQRLGQA